MKRIVLLVLFILTTLSTAFAKLPVVKKGEPLPSDLFIELAKLINPTVVNIQTTQLPTMRPRGYNDPYSRFLEQFMGPNFQMQQAQPANSLGTGFIIRKDGLIITNNHVIDKADVIKVQLNENDKALYEAKVIGKDQRTDIALIKISADRELSVAKLGQSKDLEVGEWVSAFGNPYGHGHTMTKGIISAMGRSIRELNKFSFIQTDASINPGNSGGPLVNMKGEVIGVNTAIDARAQGIGFAIPIDDVKQILPELEKKGRVKRGFIGVNIASITPQIAHGLKLDSLKGCLITQTIEKGPADIAGIRPYDVITQFNNIEINDAEDFVQAIQDARVNKTYTLKLKRAGKTKTLKVTVGENPEDIINQASKSKKPQLKKSLKAFGFKVQNYSQKLARNWDLPQLRERRPVITEVEQSSRAHRAGLSAGDIILDINQRKVLRAETVIKRLKLDQPNLLRVLRGDRVLLLQL